MICTKEKSSQQNGNIPIDEKLLNKYKNVREIFEMEGNNFDGQVNVEKYIPELENVSLSKLKIEDIKKLANKIFANHHPTNVFTNNGNKILVSKSGINESIEKIYNNRTQRNLLENHLKIFSDLGDIIEKSKLVNQCNEIKGRKKYNTWNYYFNGLKISGEKYLLEFEVVSMDNGENHYRLQRLKKTSNYDGDARNNF